MSSTDKEYIMFPKGTAVFPSLSKPDTKFDDMGMYKADIRLPEATAKPIIAKLTASASEFGVTFEDERKNNLWEFDLDDTGAPAGTVTFKLRVKNRMKKDGNLWDRRPLVLDGQRVAIGREVSIWGGSEYIVKAEFRKWEFNTKRGVQLNPVAVQVISLVSGSENHADDFAEIEMSGADVTGDAIPGTGGADY